MTGLLGAVLGAVAAMAAGTVAVIVGQARGVQRIVPVAMQPPPRAEGLIRPRLPGPPLTMTILGDSFAASYGATKPRETLGVLLGTALARRAGRPVRLHRPAFVGAMSSDLSHQVRSALKHAPDIAVIFVGGNDVTRFAPLRTAARHLGDAVGRLRATGCHVIVGTCPDLKVLPPLRPPLRWLAALRSRRLAAVQTAAVETAGGHPIPLAELLNPFFEADPVRMFGADRFHPSPDGYARAAAVSLPPLLAALRAEGLIPPPGSGSGVRIRANLAGAGDRRSTVDGTSTGRAGTAREMRNREPAEDHRYGSGHAGRHAAGGAPRGRGTG